MSSLAIAPSLNSSKWLSKASSQENLQRSLLLNAQAVSTERLTGSHGGHTKLTRKSNRQPYQELWSASTNSNPLFQASLGKNIGQQYCWCSLMWLMPLRSLSNCDYELKNLPRLILGPIHSNQVMGTDPVGSYHGTRNSWSNSINLTYPDQSHD